MKKFIIATATIVTALTLAACGEEAKAAEVTAPVVTASPFVGAEHEMEADTTIMYLGTDVSAGALDLTISVDLEGKSDNRGDLNNVNLDGAFALTESASVYMENDFNSDFERSETKVGVKYAF
jgi:uncharacterized protein with LGFP repeats